MSLEKDTTAIKQVFEADIFKPAGKKELAHRQAAAAKRRREKDKAWSAAHDGREPDTCPKCHINLRESGVERYGSTSWDENIRYDEGYGWSDEGEGEIQYHDYETSGDRCPECYADLEEGEDYNHAELKESMGVNEADVFKPAGEKELANRRKGYLNPEHLLDCIYDEMTNDDTDDSEKLWNFYLRADDRDKAVIDNVMMYVCGWTMPTLMQKAQDPRYFSGDQGPL